jgi:HSP20 family protein
MLPTVRKRSYAPAYLSDFFDSDFDSLFSMRASSPAVNIKENEKVYGIEVALPGIEKDKVNIDIEKDLLIISSEVEQEKNEEIDGYSRREFGSYSFSRSFRIPENVNSEKISASFKNGILTIELPKSEEKKFSRQVKIS